MVMMGRDDIFHKRKAKSAQALKRGGGRRDPYDKVLIVCEGEKTEPNYFKELIDYYKINTANVYIDGKCGSAPRSVIDHAIKLYNEAKEGISYDKVYCVIDRDAHADFDSAIKKLESQKPKDVFYSIVSEPCFEYWFFCHFCYSRKSYASVGKNSAGEAVLKDLKTYLPKYNKGNTGIFEELKSKLDDAINNASRSLEDAKRTNSYNPSTDVFELVNYLKNIKK